MHRPHAHKQAQSGTRGFTLIELSIVLVIIGLIFGGVLVGQGMIIAAATRATIGQFEKYNTAVHTFQTKFGYLPGDIPAAAVTQFGFAAASGRAGTARLGDGNGVIDGYNFSQSASYPVDHTGGEQEWFWEDLSTNSGLIEGKFNTGLAYINVPGNVTMGSTGIPLFLPSAKLGAGNYITVNEENSVNYFTLSAITSIAGSNGNTTAAPGLTVAQAYNMDKKIDDGLPQSGTVTAQYGDYTFSYNVLSWAAGGGTQGASPNNNASPLPTTCYDNGGNSSAPMQYSMEVSNGSGPNCALSVRMQ
jgi:prepilin-type N-terminal cleavage/methylation domain-containing protein